MPSPGKRSSFHLKSSKHDLTVILGKCQQALIQLIVFVALNIVTDILLIILPMPWLVRMKTSLKQ